MEALKDYYQALGISPSATPDEIKKAFRKLALQYHPDKNSNPQAREKFMGIQEAYKLLSNKKKRAEYNYKRYTQYPQRASRTVIQAADDLLFASSKLQKDLSVSNPHRIDRDWLFYQLSDLLSEENIFIIQESADTAIINEIARNMISCMVLLPYNVSRQLLQKLYKLGQDNPIIKQEIANALSASRQQYYWNKYKVFAAVLIAVVACLLIYFAR